ncbi:MAG: metallophosphoesterase family protein [Sphingobium sp.]
MELWNRPKRNQARSTGGRRIYAIGDVHGCFDLLVRLLQLIELDQINRPPAETHLVMLGDYVDRGPFSRDVCELLYAMRDSDYFHCLRGNHEQAMLDVLDGSPTALRFWLQYGGEETLRSWNIDPELVEHACADPDRAAYLVSVFRDAVPDWLTDWLARLPSHIQFDDYLFVHAGVRPKVALDEQSIDDLLWIREPFLSSRARHPWRVVHGHSEGEDVQIKGNRIGIDTGAYRTGILSAVGIEDGAHWIIQTES